MCLITAAPKGTKKTKEALQSFIEQGMSSNRDGSGFAAKKNGIIILDKGYRDPTDLVEAIAKLKLGLDDELIIHHRIGTSGERNDVNMHPFLVTQDLDILKTVKISNAKLPAMAHNGIFSEFTDDESKFSDTFHFIEYFMGNPKNLDFLKTDKKGFEKRLRKLISYNKLAFILPDMDMILVGNFTEDAGYFHSNNGYKSYLRDVGGSSRNTKTSTVTPVGHGIHSMYPSEEYEEVDENDVTCCNIGDKMIGRTLEGASNFLTEINKPIVPLYPTDANKLLKGKNLMFTFENMEITNNNCKHFIFIPRMFHNKDIEKNKPYHLDIYDPLAVRGPISKLGIKEVVFYEDIPSILRMSNFFVKSEFRNLYVGAFNANTFLTTDFSKKKLNLVRKLLTKNFDKSKTNEMIKSKTFGLITYNNLNFLYDKYKFIIPKVIENEGFDFAKEEKSTMEQFTLTEHDFDNLQFHPMYD